MNLQNPSFQSAQQIEESLRQLQEQVAQMEQQFGFQKEDADPSPNDCKQLPQPQQLNIVKNTDKNQNRKHKQKLSEQKKNRSKSPILNINAAKHTKFNQQQQIKIPIKSPNKQIPLQKHHILTQQTIVGIDEDLNQQKNQNLNGQLRYKNLVKIQADETKIPKKRVKPEISSKWKEVFNKKPDLKSLYNPNTWKPTFFDQSDFHFAPSYQIEDSAYVNYMNDYALRLGKSCE